MKKSGDDVPDWMLKLPQCETKEWKKVEMIPLKRKIISTTPKQNAPKRFLKNMQKHMNKHNKIVSKTRSTLKISKTKAT